jgi:hypothetical protein
MRYTDKNRRKIMKTIRFVCLVAVVSLLTSGIALAGIDRYGSMSEKKMPAGTGYYDKIVRYLPTKPFNVGVISKDGNVSYNVRYEGSFLHIWGSPGHHVYNVVTGELEVQNNLTLTKYYKVGNVWHKLTQYGYPGRSEDFVITYSEYKAAKDGMKDLIEKAIIEVKNGGTISGEVHNLKTAEKILK